MAKTSEKTKRQDFIIKRIGGILHKVSPLLDESGELIQYVTSPLMVELRNRDVIQIIVGSMLLTIPVGLTQEVWDLGVSMSLGRVLGLTVFSFAAILLFVYFNFYRNLLKQYLSEYLKRVLVIYGVSFLIVAGMLTFIDKAPWGVNNLLAIKRVLLVTFPASLSAAFGDMVK